jgi:hypothetical protein
VEKRNIECARSSFLQLRWSEIVEEAFGGATGDGVSERAERELGTVDDA